MDPSNHHDPSRSSPDIPTIDLDLLIEVAKINLATSSSDALENTLRDTASQIKAAYDEQLEKVIRERNIAVANAEEAEEVIAALTESLGQARADHREELDQVRADHELAVDETIQNAENSLHQFVSNTQREADIDIEASQYQQQIESLQEQLEMAQKKSRCIACQDEAVSQMPFACQHVHMCKGERHGRLG